MEFQLNFSGNSIQEFQDIQNNISSPSVRLITTYSHWGNSLLYRNRKVEIGVVICLRFFHSKNKNMVTKKISVEKDNSFLSHLKL